MASESSALPAPRRSINPEWTLAVLALLTFVLIPIQINTIYSGLPAHPLFLHVPVILIPVAAIGAVVLAAWPRLFARHGLWIGLVAVVALGATNLTIGAGHALRNDLNLQGSGIVAQHASAADKLRILEIVFTALLLVAIAVYRTAGPRVTGVGPLDGALGAIRSGAGLGGALRVTRGRVRAGEPVLLLSHRRPGRQGRLAAPRGWRGVPGGGGLPRGGVGGLFQGGRSASAGFSQSSRTSAPWVSNGARITVAHPSASW